MRRESELRRNESFHMVATLATAFVHSPRELAGMHVLMAIAAKLMRQLLFEITAGVAFFASDLAMPATQWESGQIMIESAAANVFPTFGRMALRAGVAETAAMRILVARCAIRKRYAGVLHKCSDRLVANFFSRRLFGVTLGARDVLVFARKHESRAFMHKFCRWFPTREIMTAFARCAELPAMLVCMTGDTCL
jgi:hypothetical protein